MNRLLGQQCREITSGTPPLGTVEIAALLQMTPGWTHTGGVIARTFNFNNYHETIAFVNAVAAVAQRENHHPEMTVGYRQCRVAFNTHSIGGISINDFICAAKLDALVSN